MPGRLCIVFGKHPGKQFKIVLPRERAPVDKEGYPYDLDLFLHACNNLGIACQLLQLSFRMIDMAKLEINDAAHHPQHRRWRDYVFAREINKGLHIREATKHPYQQGTVRFGVGSYSLRTACFSGKPRCTLLLHPDDAQAHGIQSGDQVEVRGPVGRWFTWSGEEPAIAMAGGSGLVPIIAMMRWAVRHERTDDLRVVAVGRTWELLPYAEELEAYDYVKLRSSIGC